MYYNILKHLLAYFLFNSDEWLVKKCKICINKFSIEELSRNGSSIFRIDFDRDLSWAFALGASCDHSWISGAIFDTLGIATVCSHLLFNLGCIVFGNSNSIISLAYNVTANIISHAFEKCFLSTFNLFKRIMNSMRQLESSISGLTASIRIKLWKWNTMGSFSALHEMHIKSRIVPILMSFIAPSIVWHAWWLHILQAIIEDLSVTISVTESKVGHVL